MNGILMGHGKAVGDTTISASSDDTLTLSIKLDNDKLVDWWVSHIKNGERTVMQVKSNLIFNIFGYELKTPPMEQSNTFETSMLSQISIEGTSLEVGGIKALEITRANAKWGDVDSKRTQIVIDAEVKNNMPVPIPVKFITYTIKMNGIDMGSGKVKSDAGIPPKSKRNIRVVMDIDNAKIPEWWVSHIKNGEKTTISISAKITVGLMDKEYSFKLFTQNYEFSTNLVASME
jgi:LEA14-like dessication related protein